MKKVVETLDDLKKLDAVSQILMEIHDRQCGKAMYVAEGSDPLGEFGYDVRDDLYRKLGKEMYALGLHVSENPDDDGALRIDGTAALDDIEDDLCRHEITTAADPVGELVTRYNRQRKSLHEYMTRDDNARAEVQRRRDDPNPAVCEVPPHGWLCTRTPGHDGPCAALPLPKLYDQDAEPQAGEDAPEDA